MYSPFSEEDYRIASPVIKLGMPTSRAGHRGKEEHFGFLKRGRRVFLT